MEGFGNIGGKLGIIILVGLVKFDKVLKSCAGFFKTLKGIGKLM